MYHKLFVLFVIIFTISCKEKKSDNNYDYLTQEDIKTLEETSLSTLELIEYSGKFEGDYFEDNVKLTLKKNGNYQITFRNNVIEGKWFKKDDGSLIEFDSKKALPFQFMKWSDNSTLMILNADGTADDEGGNYLTRIK